MGYTGRSEREVQSPPEMARLDRKEVDSTLPDYMQLMKEIRVRPYLKAGRPAGFLIYNIEPGSILSRMGLENGDVINAVNGRRVATTQEASEFYGALKSGTKVSLNIQRDERAQELQFEIR
jgi:S1-C subfamily serine protease